MLLAFYRALLHLYPRAFHDEYGREMTIAFRDRMSNENHLMLAASTFLDTVSTAAGVHGEMLWQDLTYGARSLRKDLPFAAASIATLALGIGATTGMFSMVHAVLLRPLPFEDPDRLVRIYDSNASLRIEQFSSSAPNLQDWRNRNKSFSALAGFQFLNVTVADGSNAERVQGLALLGPFWDAIGQNIILGRAFTVDESRNGGTAVVVLGEGFWQRRFARDPGVLGKTITVDGVSKAIVGVAPSDLGLESKVDVFAPFVVDPESRGDRQLDVVGRLRPGVTIMQASQELNSIAAQLDNEYSKANQGWRTTFQSANDWVVEPKLRSSLYVLLGAVSLLLAIACVNVANLLVARAAARKREIGARLAMGANRARLVRQFITESLLLGVCGGFSGVLLSWIFLRLLSPFMPSFASRVELNWPVIGFALVVTTSVSLLFGLGPAIAGTRSDLRNVLQSSARSDSAATSNGAVRRLLVISQVALASILLVGALLLTVSFRRMIHQDFGFRSDHLLTARFTPPPGKFEKRGAWARHVDAILTEMRSLPGVKSAAITSEIPFGEGDTQQGVIAEERAGLLRTEGIQSSWRLVSAGYFETMGVPLLKGRLWTSNENYSARPIIISRDLASRLWSADVDPIGRQVRMSNNSTFTVIGVVGDVQHRNLAEAGPTNSIYWPGSLFNWATMSIVLRTEGDPASMATSMREAMRRVDPQQPLFEISTFDDFVAKTASAPRLAALLLALFAALALLLAVVGVAGLTVYAVARRRSELAVRMALGATAIRVIKDVVTQQFQLCALGVLAGFAGAWTLRPMVVSMLFGVDAGHLPSYIAAGAVLLGAGLLASLIPAMRISAIDPALALRSD